MDSRSQASCVTTSDGLILSLTRAPGHLCLRWDTVEEPRENEKAIDPSSLFAGTFTSPHRSSLRQGKSLNGFTVPDQRPQCKSDPPPLFTQPELRSIHHRSGHPHWRRMLHVLKRLQQNRCPPDLRAQLQEIVMACKACSNCGATPRRARISLPHPESEFNEEVIADI